MMLLLGYYFKAPIKWCYCWGIISKLPLNGVAVGVLFQSWYKMVLLLGYYFKAGIKWCYCWGIISKLV
jgi:hypothetical protein